MALIDVIQYDQSEGELRQIYNDLIEKRGKLAEVHKILSLNPRTIVTHMDLYMSIMFDKSPLRRYQREMIGVIVSANNHCEYCVRHHEEALLHFWKERSKTTQLINNYSLSDITEKDLLLCQLAEFITKNPNFDQKETMYNEMRSVGLNDRCILDANLVAAYFNFVNRLVLGLGVDLNEEEFHGYNYD
jgi:uncharacterized peroxidase-related enzyme